MKTALPALTLHLFPVSWPTLQFKDHEINSSLYNPVNKLKLLQPLLLPVFFCKFFFKQRTELKLIVGCNPLPWRPECRSICVKVNIVSMGSNSSMNLSSGFSASTLGDLWSFLMDP